MIFSSGGAPLPALRDADPEGLLVEPGAGVDAGLQAPPGTLLVVTCRSDHGSQQIAGMDLIDNNAIR